ncbi:MAG: hypothetical protein M1543_02340 [Firmicutes bacterium]|nr:hypothetical protein [Bacillota bacterium]
MIKPDGGGGAKPRPTDIIIASSRAMFKAPVNGPLLINRHLTIRDNLISL